MVQPRKLTSRAGRWATRGRAGRVLLGDVAACWGAAGARWTPRRPWASVGGVVEQPVSELHRRQVPVEDPF